jgi:hypothetical protein
MIVAGNHIYERCGYCRKLVRMTGWFAGVHVCLLPEERAAIDRRRLQPPHRHEHARDDGSGEPERPA